jgi:formamidopyrimidine-DNA glycosylase
MIEIPEAVNLARQITKTLKAKKVARAIAGFSPHKFAWYHGDPKGYDALLSGKTVGTAVARAGMVEIQAEDAVLLFSDGVALRFHDRVKSGL